MYKLPVLEAALTFLDLRDCTEPALAELFELDFVVVWLAADLTGHLLCDDLLADLLPLRTSLDDCIFRSPPTAVSASFSESRNANHAG